MKITGLHLILLLYMHGTATLFATFCVIVVSEAVVGTHGIRKVEARPYHGIMRVDSVRASDTGYTCAP